MNVLVIGSGGREHAIVDALHRSPTVERLFCAPGNAGIGELAEIVGTPATDIPALIDLAKREFIDLAVVGPEQPLVAGIVDAFQSAGIHVFGPQMAAARLEGSKAFAKSFMTKHRIPTARSVTISRTNADEAGSIMETFSLPVVVKADGLAAGKGVIICEAREEALEHVGEMLSGKAFGASGHSAIIEEFLVGEEASVFVLTDGSSYKVLPAAQDHKRVFDRDMGKNTGGMGAYAPAPAMTPSLCRRVEESIVRPTLDGMKVDGTPYAGCLFVGLVLTEGGPKVLEYNCRFGDPETQVVLPLLDGDLARVFMDIARGTFDPASISIVDGSAVCVVLASRGYPDAYEKGKKIEGLDSLRASENVRVYHAGTKLEGRDVVTDGGRVLGVTAFGPPNDIAETIRRAYDAVTRVTFEGAHFRRDIGAHALQT